MGAFVISKRFNGVFKFVFSSRKGKTIFTSMGYESYEDCSKDIAVLILNIEAVIYQKVKGSNGKHIFRILIEERVLAVSRKYSTELMLQKGIDEITKYASKAEILDFSNDDVVFFDLDLLEETS
jgi:uncharacterized protein YegP (UPF0339 family)